MSRINKANPHNSSTLQLCLDAASLGVPEFLEIYNKLKTERPDVLSEIDDKFKSHKYPDTSLTWVKLKNFENCRSLTQLTFLTGGENALALLMLLVQNTHQDLLVQCSISVAMKILHKSKQSIINSFAILQEFGFITIVKQTVGDSNVYMLNPQIVMLGQSNEKYLIDTFEDYVLQNDSELKPLFYFSWLGNVSRNYFTNYSKYKDIDNGLVFYNTFISVEQTDEQAQEKPVSKYLPKKKTK